MQNSGFAGSEQGIVFHPRSSSKTEGVDGENTVRAAVTGDFMSAESRRNRNRNREFDENGAFCTGISVVLRSEATKQSLDVKRFPYVLKLLRFARNDGNGRELNDLESP
jgi:hypothetical protein